MEMGGLVLVRPLPYVVSRSGCKNEYIAGQNDLGTVLRELRSVADDERRRGYPFCAYVSFILDGKLYQLEGDFAGRELMFLVTFAPDYEGFYLKRKL